MDTMANQHLQLSRINSLDVLRGFALLGILIMNIQSFAMPIQGYFNPFAFSEVEGTVLQTQGLELFNLNGLVYLFTHIIADQKFMTIFSLLFGIGIALMGESYKRKLPLVNNKAVSPLTFLLRRHFFLLLLGLAHAYLIWEGDILVTYSLCGFFVVWFRDKSPSFLMSFASGLFLLPIILLWIIGIFVPEELLTPELEVDWLITTEQFLSNTSTMQGSWLEQMPYRAFAVLEIQVAMFLIYSFWRVSSLMLLGMALYKLRLFDNKRSPKTLLKWACIMTVIGWAITGAGVYQNDIHQWQAFYANIFASQFNYFGSLISGVGYIFAALYLYRYLPKLLSNTLEAVGRTALSNYILQSFICSFIFYGHGLGLFAQLDRFQQLMLLPFVWVLQSLLSIFWLKYFRQGPLEWIWRCAVSWSVLPLKK